MARANLIVNGGFETPKVVANGIVEYGALNTALNPWVIVAGSVDLVSNGFWAAYEGNQSLDLNGSNSGTIVQQFSVTPENRYTLTFQYANDPTRANYTATANVLVFSDPTDPEVNQSISHKDSVRTNSDTMKYVGFSTTFTADAASMSLEFKSTFAGANGIVLDAVSIVPARAAPEPGSLALMSLGVCTLLGLSVEAHCKRAIGRGFTFPK